MTVTDTQLAALRASIESAQPQFRADLRELVSIDCGTYSKFGVDAVGAIVGARFADLGATVTTVPSESVGDTVVTTWTGDGGPSLLIIGHMDTVYPDGTAAARPYSERGSRAYGPGVTDMKAGLLAGIHAIRAVLSDDGLPFSRL